MSGLVGSTWEKKPSPPWVMNQSALAGPWWRSVRFGPPSVLLSWVPP